MSKHDDGGPASEKSLLDWFAGQASEDDIQHHMSEYRRTYHGCCTREQGKYIYAAAMIAEKRRREGGAE